MKSSSTLRRISWSLGIPMTKCMEYIFEYLPKILDKKKSAKDAGTRPNAKAVRLIQTIRHEKEVRYDTKSKRDTKHHY